MVTSADRSDDQKAPSRGLTRREFLPLLSAATLATVATRSRAAAAARASGAEARFVYVGTYTAPGVPPGGTHPSTAVGIYVFRMDPTDGGLTPVQIVTTDNPSFLALDPTLTHLYSTNENVGGRFSAYAIDQGNGALTFLNTQPSHGDFPAHLGVHPSGAYLLGTNYGTGNYPIYRINADGSIGDGIVSRAVVRAEEIGSARMHPEVSREVAVARLRVEKRERAVPLVDGVGAEAAADVLVRRVEMRQRRIERPKRRVVGRHDLDGREPAAGRAPPDR